MYAQSAACLLIILDDPRDGNVFGAKAHPYATRPDMESEADHLAIYYTLTESIHVVAFRICNVYLRIESVHHGQQKPFAIVCGPSGTASVSVRPAG